MITLTLHDRDVVHDNSESISTLPEGVRFPHELVSHPDLTTDEKRRLLSKWASDRCAVPNFPTLRQFAGSRFPVTFSAIMDALEQLDREAPASLALGSNRRRGGNDASAR